MTVQLQRFPDWRDPRVPFLALLCSYLVVGISLLGFDRTPQQILLTIAAACLLDVVLHYAYRRELLFPLSAAITGASIGILVNYAHNPWLVLIPVFFAVVSKYSITFDGRHVYNPSLFGIVISLLISDGMISVAPPYQWGSSPMMALVIVTAALLFFVFRIRRGVLILSFIGFYTIALCYRAWLTRYHVPPETLILGSLLSPTFYLFAFFMITDPATSPRSKSGQILMAALIVAIDLLLHKLQSYSTLFFAGFLALSARFVFLHLSRLRLGSLHRPSRGLLQLALPASVAGLIWFGYQQANAFLPDAAPGFRFEEIAADDAGISSRPGDILERVDARIAHVAKWILSIGDSVAIADANNDGLADIFLTYPMKSAQDRAALYLNLGDFKFERVAIPALAALVTEPQQHGLPSGALWLDYDNDGDRDLFVLLSFGSPHLLQNRLIEESQLAFVDVSRKLDMQAYITSLTANAIDIDRDGRLDIVLGNTSSPWLPGYEQPTKFNIFELPQPAYPGDRRMFNFMHRGWYDANNGGENLVFMNRQNDFRARSGTEFGLDGYRWTMDIGTGDVDGDGWTDLYLANDFGPDSLYLNNTRGGFREISGPGIGSIGKDIYKGMNASLGDFDNNGFADIYVSNVHEKLQAEGSLLWMNDGSAVRRDGAAFSDRTLAQNVVNEQRFGWGAALGDLDRDGRLDIVQANGMVDDSYDKRFDDCPDYWYWNEKIALTVPDIHGYADNWADLRGYCIFPNERNRVYLNRADGFVDVAAQTGLGEPGNSRGVALADLDNDGDLDMLITHQFAPVSIYRNDAQPAAWLGLSLQGNGEDCNRDAIGSRVELIDADDRLLQWREMSASNGFSAQGDARMLFGLGNRVDDVELRVHWCGARGAETYRLRPGRYHRLLQGSAS